MSTLDEVDSAVGKLTALMPRPVQLDVQREIRFAVVMYGGVSLAIYINGVAQELLNLVRATAPKKRGSIDPRRRGAARAEPALLTEDELTGAGKVYRRLGRHLSIQDLDARLQQLTQDNSTDAPITTQFIVDVISGTSAGGINGVFLAKALAQNQTMLGLKQLWLSEGDLDKLLNDKRSLKGLPGFRLKQPPNSLLNSQRMYRKLLEALAQMDSSGASSSVYLRDELPAHSPLVDELDLFTTTTDIEGLPLPIGLSDRLVFERRFKNVFHFRYAREEDRDDFLAQNDPFLAFAARCTSSFPFAFEPTRLDQTIDIAQNHPRYFGAKDYIPEKKWDKFYGDYLRLGLFDLDRDSRGEETTGKVPQTASGDPLQKAKDNLRDAFLARSFGDGGYLDNKPFTYATATLGKRLPTSDLKRKLLYVEPSPDHPELVRSDPEMPDFAENVRAAVLDLPRQETIREDIERLQERNGVVNRLTTFAQEVDNDFATERLEPLAVRKFRTGYVKDVVNVKGYGIGYGPYHRLMVAEITSFLAEIVARAKEQDPTSNAGLAIREVVAAWRRSKFSPQPEEGKISENKFLFYYNLHYRFRRVAFLICRVNGFRHLNPFSDGHEQERLKRILRNSLDRARKQKHPEITLDANCAKSVDLWLSGKKPAAKAGNEVNFEIWWNAFTTELNRIKNDALVPALRSLRETEHNLLGLGSRLDDRSRYGKELNRFRQILSEIGVPWPDLRDILSLADGGRRKKADEICQARRAKLDAAARSFHKILWLRQPKISEQLNPELPKGLDRDDLEGLRAARLCVLYYNKNFIFYDLVRYPVEYGTQAGETVEVELFRVSPEDAPSLMDETPGDEKASKLAGRTLMSFGAFLDEPWRRNDMLWGRLDGAERLITALLPLPDKILKKPDEMDEQTKQRLEIDAKHNQRCALICEAHLGILLEEIKDDNADAVCALLRHAAFQRQKGPNVEKLIAALLSERDEAVVSKLTPERRALLGKPQLLDRQLNPQAELKYISRSTNITGDMLAGLADKYHFERGKKIAGWIATVGKTLWSIIAVAVPQSLGNLFYRHLLGLFYFFAFVLIFAGIFLNNSVKFAGWELLAILVLVQIVVSGADAFMRGKRWFMNFMRAAILSPVVALIILGLLHLAKRWRHFHLDRGPELLFALGAAFTVVLFLIVVPRISRGVLSFCRRIPQYFKS